MKKNQFYQCPKCGSKNVFISDDYKFCNEKKNSSTIIIEASCPNCNFSFSNYVKCIYDGYSYFDKNGNFKDFDENGDKL